MTQHVQELIDKIKSEGIEEAQLQAKTIEKGAQEKAQSIVDDAQKHAERILKEAKDEIHKKQTATQMALKQAARDMLLSLRKEIEHTLHSIISADVKEALTPEALAKIIEAAAAGFLKHESEAADIKVAVSPGDYEKLKKGFTRQLKERLKKPITFEAAHGIGKGFTISFDQGKSCFDFSDESLAEYLSLFLNKEVAELIKGSIK